MCVCVCIVEVLPGRVCPMLAALGGGGGPEKTESSPARLLEC